VRQTSVSTLITEDGSKQPSKNASDRTERTAKAEGSHSTRTIETAPDSVLLPYELDLNDNNNDSDGGDDDNDDNDDNDDDDSIDIVAEMEKLRHSKSMQKRHRSSRRQKIAHGEFVWVLDGKTHQPARLVRLASELNQKYQEGSLDNNNISNNPQEEELTFIQWTRTGLFAWVPKRDVLVKKANSREAVREESALDMAVHGAPAAESNSIMQKATVLDATIHTTNKVHTPDKGSSSRRSSHFCTAFDQSASGRRIMKCQDNIIAVVSDDENIDNDEVPIQPPWTRAMSQTPATSTSQRSSRSLRKPRRNLSLDSSKRRRSSAHNRKNNNTEDVVIDEQQQLIEVPQLTRAQSHTPTRRSPRLPRRALSLDSPDRKTKKRSIEETAKSTKTPTTLESQTPKVRSRRSSRTLAPKRILSLDSMHKTPPTLEFQTPKAQPRRSLRRLSPKQILTLDSSTILPKGGKRFSPSEITTMADNDVQATPKPAALMPPIATPKRVLDSSTSSKIHAERSPLKGLEKKNLPGSASNASKISQLMKRSTTSKTPKAAVERSPSKRLHKKHKPKSDSNISEMIPNTPTSNSKAGSHDQVREMVTSCNELRDMLHDLIAPPPLQNPKTPRKPRIRKRLQVESNFKALNSKMITTVGVGASPAASPATNSATSKSLNQKRTASEQSRQKLKDAFNRMFGTGGSKNNSVSATSPTARTQKKSKRIAETK
jgi:hypothetical protein